MAGRGEEREPGMPPAHAIWKGKQYGMPYRPGRAGDVRQRQRAAGRRPRPGQAGQGLGRGGGARAAHLPRRGGQAGLPALTGAPAGNALWLVPFWQLGGETIDKDGARITIDNEHGIKALEWLKRLYDLQGGWNSVAAGMQAGAHPQRPLHPGHHGLLLRHLHRAQEPRVPDRAVPQVQLHPVADPQGRAAHQLRGQPHLLPHHRLQDPGRGLEVPGVPGPGRRSSCASPTTDRPTARRPSS